MESNKSEIIKLLEKERDEHLDELKRINWALQALTNGAETIHNGKIASQKVSWTREINKLFNDNNELSIDDIRNGLIEKGITKASERNCKNTISSTLRRMVDSNELEKTQQRTYRKKLMVPDITSEDNVPF